LNFYTEYSESSNITKDEHRKKQANHTPIVDTTDNSVTPNPDRYKGAYVVIDNRQFYIGKRGGNGYTYPLGVDGIKKLIKDIGDLPIEIDKEFIEDKFIDENGTEDNRAEWKPYVKIGGIEYNLMNSNSRALKESTSIHLVEYFSQLGLEAACQCISSKKSIYRPPQKNKKSKKSKEETHIQMSLFD
jgi:hypothetical protein